MFKLGVPDKPVFKCECWIKMTLGTPFHVSYTVSSERFSFGHMEHALGLYQWTHVNLMFLTWIQGYIG